MYTEFKDQTTPAWDGFHGTQWRYEINVREFIQDNYLPYDGDESFLAGPTGPGPLWPPVPTPATVQSSPASSPL